MYPDLRLSNTPQHTQKRLRQRRSLGTCLHFCPREMLWHSALPEFVGCLDDLEQEVHSGLDTLREVATTDPVPELVPDIFDSNFNKQVTEHATTVPGALRENLLGHTAGKSSAEQSSPGTGFPSVSATIHSHWSAAQRWRSSWRERLPAARLLPGGGSPTSSAGVGCSPRARASRDWRDCGWAAPLAKPLEPLGIARASTGAVAGIAPALYRIAAGRGIAA